jgi:dihydroceramide fatty acyl 2-hydroxylase
MALIRYTQDCLDAAQGKWPATGDGYYDAPREPSAARRRDRPVSIRVFENGFIETIFAKAHPITPILWFGPCIGYGLYLGVTRRGVLGAGGLFLFGWLLWTLLEYLLHRYVFHMAASTPEKRFRQFMAHGYHHEFPNDKYRLVAPPLMSWPLAVVVGGLFRLAFGPETWLMVFAGTCTGYIAYDWIHYYTHHFRPRNPVGKWLKSYHLLHHFDENHGRKRYGVSSPLWDFVFGTYLPLRKTGR